MTTNLTPALKAKIDAMTFQDMLREIRFASNQSDIFIGAAADYFQRLYVVRRENLGPGEYAEISKAIGWRDGKF